MTSPCKDCGATSIQHAVDCRVIYAVRRSHRALAVRVYERELRLRRTTDFHALVWRTA